jgi:glyoxylase-like metal-dependent hydrolase (beta-lactamase superfamily II)
MSAKPEMSIKAFYDQQTNTVSYVVSDDKTRSAAIIDPVLGIDYAAGQLSYSEADIIVDYVKSTGLRVEWLIETHVHADHLSASPYLQSLLGGKIAISEKIVEVQNVFGKMFNAGTSFERDGRQFDHLFTDNETYQIGQLTGKALHTPGHTPACMAHYIGDAIFVGDTLFMPDSGTARADFPGGDARTLYRSIKRILTMPSETRIFVCHDYAPNGRDVAWETTVEEELAHNIHIGGSISEDDFVAMREQRDQDLDMPRLIMPSIQINMRAGHMPPPEGNGQVYIKVPVSDPRQ